MNWQIYFFPFCLSYMVITIENEVLTAAFGHVHANNQQRLKEPLSKKGSGIVLNSL